MPKSQRLSVRLAVALLAVSASLLAAARFQGPLAAPVAHASCDVCTGTW